jgi:NifU-like protein involved in Fe-S cluster formation
MSESHYDTLRNDQYSALVVEHFERPRNLGRWAPGDDVVTGEAGRPAEGVRFVLSAKIADNRLREPRYEAYGCPHCIAAGSWMTQQLEGATCEDLERWSWRAAAEMLEVPAEKRGRLLILEDAVRALAASWRGRT